MSVFSKLFGKKTKAPLQKQSVDLSTAKTSRLMPYGHQLGDGRLQLSFTLPVPASKQVYEAAQKYVEKLNLHEVKVLSVEPITKQLSFCIVEAQAEHSIDFTKIKSSNSQTNQANLWDQESIQNFAADKLRRRLTVLGATLGESGRELGMELIFTLRGNGENPGLEAYSCFKTFNSYGTDEETLIQRAIQCRADVVLVSKAGSRRGRPLEDLKSLAKGLQSAKNLPSPFLKIVVAPQLTLAQGKKLGYDAGFDPWTPASEVGSFIVQQYLSQKK